MDFMIMYENITRIFGIKEILAISEGKWKVDL